MSEIFAFLVCIMFLLNLKLFIMIETTYNFISTVFWFFIMFCLIWYAFYHKISEDKGKNGNIKK